MVFAQDLLHSTCVGEILDTVPAQTKEECVMICVRQGLECQSVTFSNSSDKCYVGSTLQLQRTTCIEEVTPVVTLGEYKSVSQPF